MTLKPKIIKTISHTLLSLLLSNQSQMLLEIKRERMSSEAEATESVQTTAIKTVSASTHRIKNYGKEKILKHKERIKQQRQFESIKTSASIPSKEVKMAKSSKTNKLIIQNKCDISLSQNIRIKSKKQKKLKTILLELQTLSQELLKGVLLLLEK